MVLTFLVSNFVSLDVYYAFSFLFFMSDWVCYSSHITAGEAMTSLFLSCWKRMNK